jgi:hypothetical protein
MWIGRVESWCRKGYAVGVCLVISTVGGLLMLVGVEYGPTSILERSVVRDAIFFIGGGLAFGGMTLCLASVCFEQNKRPWNILLGLVFGVAAIGPVWIGCMFARVEYRSGLIHREIVRRVLDSRPEYASPAVMEFISRKVSSEKISATEVVDRLIGESIPGTEGLLEKLLAKYDSKEIATLLLRSRNKNLNDAAVRWAHANGFSIKSVPKHGAGQRTWSGN